MTTLTLFSGTTTLTGKKLSLHTNINCDIVNNEFCLVTITEKTVSEHNGTLVESTMEIKIQPRPGDAYVRYLDIHHIIVDHRKAMKITY